MNELDDIETDWDRKRVIKCFIVSAGRKHFGPFSTMSDAELFMRLNPIKGARAYLGDLHPKMSDRFKSDAALLEEYSIEMKTH